MLISTPIELIRLDDEDAIFAGSAEESVTAHGLLGGAIEGTRRYPSLLLQRSVWESLGRPTRLMLELAELEVTST